MKLSATQRKVLEAMQKGATLAYGQYGGVIGFLQYQHGSGGMSIHNNTIKALLRRQCICQEGRQLVISSIGSAALEEPQP